MLTFSEISTHYSTNCCIQMSADNCRSVRTLTDLIQSCNRSVPHIEVISITFEIFMNLAECKVSPNLKMQAWATRRCTGLFHNYEQKWLGPGGQHLGSPPGSVPSLGEIRSTCQILGWWLVWVRRPAAGHAYIDTFIFI